MSENEESWDRFSGIGRLYGVQALEDLRRSHVCVIGLGGVGSWAAEALVRTGIGGLTMIDMDDICVSNSNRQLHTMNGTVGRTKVSVLAERFSLISPACRIEVVEDFVLPSTVERWVTRDFDVVLDAIDDLRNKCLLIDHACRLEIPVVTVGGAGGRRDPTQIRRADLRRSSGDGLLRQVRRMLRKDHGWGDREGDWGVPCIFSEEPPVYPSSDGGVCGSAEADGPRGLDCATGFGAATFVTGAFGFAAASATVDLLTAR